MSNNPSMMKTFLFLLLCFTVHPLFAQQKTANDGDWSQQYVAIKNTPEAEFMIRSGDIDNLGFQFAEGFNPFCGRSTEAHYFPWDPAEGDAPGTDRIMVPSSYVPELMACGGDGYSATSDGRNVKVVPIGISLESVKGATIKDAYLQLFIDDFQSPSMCSHFQVTLNGKRFVEAEKVLRAIDQTGPVGKLITLPIPESFYPELQAKSLAILIDDPTSHAGDGFAIDFAKLIINRKANSACKGSLVGIVVDNETGEPIPGAIVQGSAREAVTTDVEGGFKMSNIPAGLEILTATAKGYAEGSGVADVAEGDEGEPVYIRLSKTGKKASYNGKAIIEGESIVMNKILFDQGSAALKPESKTELDQIANFLKSNPNGEIELSGHTSSEGDASLNKSLSYKRVNACKEYIVSKGIDVGRIIAVGYGPDRPVAPNDTEAGRAQNRRVEMKVLKL